MKFLWHLACLCLLLCPSLQAQERTIAVTIDDLPVTGGGTLQRRQAVTEGILAHLRHHEVPAIGFVNERGLGNPPLLGRVKLLERWLEEGMELGNHSYSHPSFYTTPYVDYLADVVRGEKVIRPLLKRYGKALNFYRHPYLNTGPNLENKENFEAELARRNYRVAPVTIDNSEWKFARAYDRANGNSELRKQIAEAYIVYMESMTLFFEDYSRELFKREPSQILLIHANALNAHHLDELLIMYRKRGYKFVSLEQALRDSVYQSEDQYTGQRGISWLQRWNITRGGDFRTEPSPPAWITP